jgi:hypothetical protein
MAVPHTGAVLTGLFWGIRAEFPPWHQVVAQDVAVVELAVATPLKAIDAIAFAWVDATRLLEPWLEVPVP